VHQQRIDEQPGKKPSIINAKGVSLEKKTESRLKLFNDKNISQKRVADF
jgi:hypothetical protein